MYKGASQGQQTHLSRKSVFDAGAAAARADAVPISKKQARKNFCKAVLAIEHQISMTNPGSARRKELGLQLQKLQRQREQEKGVGIGGGKPNAKRISDLFREKIFALLPDDAPRFWAEAVADEAAERELSIQQIEI